MTDLSEARQKPGDVNSLGRQDTEWGKMVVCFLFIGQL